MGDSYLGGSKHAKNENIGIIDLMNHFELIKLSIEIPILLDFVNQSQMFCKGLQTAEILDLIVSLSTFS